MRWDVSCKLTMSGEADLEHIRGHFRFFDRAVADLPLYHSLTLGCADDPEVAGLLLAAQPGQARPVLFFAAVHDLVLRHPELPLARWYRSVTPDENLATGDVWPLFRSTCLAHADALKEVIATRTTQTNEVNRVAVLAPLVAEACRDVPDLPVTLVELGASAGLLLGFEGYRIDVGGVIVGDPASSVHVTAGVRGDRRPDLSTFPTQVAERVGIDQSPVALDDPDEVRWLEACLWPDQPWRVKRFRAAIAALHDDPPRIVAGDLVDDLEAIVDGLADDTHLVVCNGWALTYVARDRRQLVADALGRVARSGRPVSWATAEAPRCVPGIISPIWIDDEESTPDTVLGLHRWRDGASQQPVALGWAHPHGNWLQLTPPTELVAAGHL